MLPTNTTVTPANGVTIAQRPRSFAIGNGSIAEVDELGGAVLLRAGAEHEHAAHVRDNEQRQRNAQPEFFAERHGRLRMSSSGWVSSMQTRCRYRLSSRSPSRWRDPCSARKSDELSASPGKVGTGFPTRTCAKRKKRASRDWLAAPRRSAETAAATGCCGAGISAP